MTYAGTVGADSPVGYWKLGETGTTTASDSGSGTAFNGTYTGTYVQGINGIDGAESGMAVNLAGTGYISFSGIPSKLQFAGSYSIECWFAFMDDTSTGQALVTEAYAGDGTVRYMLGFFDGGSGTRKPSFGFYNGGWRLVQSATAITDGLWHHMVGTWDGTQHRLYVDNSLVAGPTTPAGGAPTGSEALYIGRRWDANTFFPGYVDEVAMYAAALNTTQIGNHYNAKNLAATGTRATQELGEVVSAFAGSPNARVTQELAEVVVTDSTPTVRVTQQFVEVVAEVSVPLYPDGYWGVYLGDIQL